MPIKRKATPLCPRSLLSPINPSNYSAQLNNHQLKLVGLGYGLEVLIRVA